MYRSIRDLFLENLRDWAFRIGLFVVIVVVIAILLGAGIGVVCLAFYLLSSTPIPLWSKILAGIIGVALVILAECYFSAKREYHRLREEKYHIHNEYL